MSVARELEIEIVPLESVSEQAIIDAGISAYSGAEPVRTNPLTPAFNAWERATQALCHLNTAGATRALVNLLAQGHSQVQPCLEPTPNLALATEEMSRLLIDPDVAVTPAFFSTLVNLRERPQADGHANGMFLANSELVQTLRDTLFASLPKKVESAVIPSLATVLEYSAYSKPVPGESTRSVPFADSVIAMTAANFDRLPANLQAHLLNSWWDRIDSPIMLPVARRFAEAGNGNALLHWLELDPTTATSFMRAEVVRPTPGFSSFFLRLPDAALPEQEAQIAANFIALNRQQQQDMPALMRSASLLHRYATATVLPTLLPVIDAKLLTWPHSVQIPMLAYLLKVSPAEAEARVRRALEPRSGGPYQWPTLLTDIGILEHGPVLERLAVAQVEANSDRTRDALEYIRLFGSAPRKPMVWQWLVQAEKAEKAAAAVGVSADTAAMQATQRRSDRLWFAIEAYEKAHNWLLTRAEDADLKDIIGSPAYEGLACNSACGVPVSVPPSPGMYYIHAQFVSEAFPGHQDMDFLDSRDRLSYSILQYGCRDMAALQEKILQFPKGSSFSFGWNFDARVNSELLTIISFLRSHGYMVSPAEQSEFVHSLIAGSEAANN